LSVLDEYGQSLTDVPETDGEIRLCCIVVGCETFNGRASSSKMLVYGGNLSYDFHGMVFQSLSRQTICDVDD
jgi:hypothetical protein